MADDRIEQPRSLPVTDRFSLEGQYALVIGGTSGIGREFAKAYLEAGVQHWDLAAHAVMVEEAGGRFTDLSGKRTATSGHCLATNGRLHDELLRALTAAADPS